MKTVKFRDLPLENRVFDKEEKDDGNHIHQMTTEITSPSSAQWLENFDDQDNLLDYFLSGEHDEGGNGNANGSHANTNTTTSSSTTSNMNHNNNANAPAATMNLGHKMTNPTDKTGSVISPALGYESVSHQSSEFHSQSQYQPDANSNANANANSSASTHTNSHNHGPLTTPSTPAMQFYAGVSNKSSARSSNHSSSSSINTNTNTDQHHAAMNSSSLNPNPQEQSVQNQNPTITFPQHNASQQQQQQQHSQNNHSSSKPDSSSPSLLQGMGSTPVLHLHQQFKAQGSSSSGGGATPFSVPSTSPISPALMCTNELLMLPSNTPTGNVTGAAVPKPTVGPSAVNVNASSNPQHWQNHGNMNAARAAMNPSTANPNQHPPTPANNQGQPLELPAWLQHMNNVASLASQAGTSGSAMAVSGGYPNQSHSHSHPAFYHASAQPQQQPQPTGVNQLQIFSSGTDILPIPGSVTAMHQRIHIGEEHALESKEKRKKRLARNRESARQSRRRKKELLLNLRKQVNELHDKIEFERRKKLECMEEHITADRVRILNEIFSDQRYNGRSVAGMDRFIRTVRNSGPMIKERRAALEFQHDALKKLILPVYRRIFMSMSLKDRSFLTEAKEKKIKETQKTTGRVSSKLVGEDITRKHMENLKEGHAIRNNVSCSSDDNSAFWPLLCYELSIGIEQEEKFVHAFDKIRMDPEVPNTRKKMSTVSTMVSSLKDSLLTNSRSVTNRNEIALLQILTPAQSLRYLEWFLRNKNRCSKLLANTNNKRGGVDHENTNVMMKKAESMTELRKQLTETKIEQEVQNTPHDYV